MSEALGLWKGSVPEAPPYLLGGTVGHDNGSDSAILLIDSHYLCHN